MEQSTKILFHVSGKEYKVDPKDVTPETTLNTYLRDKIKLTGTKRMCLEGGCGTCVVAVEDNDTHKVLSVNSCLVSIFSCHGWKIHTVEGIGGPTTEYNPIQKTLANFNGTQCGFCSPGMVMNMFALVENGELTMQKVEDSFGGNICRCTGYRPILTAFKSLAHDADKNLLGEWDIEDLKPCPRMLKLQGMSRKEKKKGFMYKLGDKSTWTKVYTLADLLSVLRTFDTPNYMLVAGNTARGVYRRNKIPDHYVDVSQVKELTTSYVQNNAFVIGVNVTLNNAIDLFYKTAKNKPLAYLKQIADHITLVANTPVRNIGTLAGNLMTKYTHKEFPSDIFLLLETFQAKIVIVDLDENEFYKKPSEFLKLDMKNKVLKQIILGPLDDSFYYNTYKIMARAQSVHALVNGGFLLKLENNVVKSANIVYGSINPTFIHATETENVLKGKQLFNNDTFQKVFNSLDVELKPDYVLPDASPEFRKQLAISLMYKFLLGITPTNLLSGKNKSGGSMLKRPISSGAQTYDSKKSLYPLTQPITKLEALAQTSGQAEYIPDIPDLPYQLFGSFVFAKTMPNSVILSVDTNEALKLSGVVAYFDKGDIPGENNSMPPSVMPTYTIKEEIFCSGTVKYYSQPIGLIIAKDITIARQAANLVKVKYKEPSSKPYITIKQIVDGNATSKIKKEKTYPAKRKGNDVKHVIKDSFQVFMQYHFYMELQCCNIEPKEDGILIHPSSQFINLSQSSAAEAIQLPANRVSTVVRRVGGAYGGKISRNAILTCAASIAAHKLKKPIKMWMTIEENMNSIGKRYPFQIDYEIGVNNDGACQYMNCDFYIDYGAGGNENIQFLIDDSFVNYYNSDTWTVNFFHTNSDTTPGTWCRGPGTLEPVSALETIMEQIAYVIDKDPIDVRLANLDKTKHAKLIELIERMRKWVDFDARKADIKKFNSENRWKKKGISVVAMDFPLTFAAVLSQAVLVSIYHTDGSVSVAHGGIELGQGINTKVAQVCAYKLGIPLNKVWIKPSNDFQTPNAGITGGSITSEGACFAVLKACEMIQNRLEPIKAKMNNPKWLDLIQKAHEEGVELCATYKTFPTKDNLERYNVYGVCTAEVEVDILTGQHQITSVKLLEDTGESMSPLLDVGQIEGAFVMGLGYFLTEKIVYDDNGIIKTNRTWNYLPPGAKDIPIDFQIVLVDGKNPTGVLNSKAQAEAPMTLSLSVPLAIRNAIASARNDADSKQPKWYPFRGPSTVEYNYLNSLNNFKQYTL